MLTLGSTILIFYGPGQPPDLYPVRHRGRVQERPAPEGVASGCAAGVLLQQSDLSLAPTGPRAAQLEGPPGPEDFSPFEGHSVRRTGGSERAPGDDGTAGGARGATKTRSASSRAARRRVSTVAVRFSSFVNDSGYECMHDGTRCRGDCRDAIYAKATVLEWALLCNVIPLLQRARPFTAVCLRGSTL